MAVQRSGSSIDLRPFETIDPKVEEVQEAGQITIRIHLPGFKKEHLRVHLSSSRTLKVRGERSPYSRWARFQKEFVVSQGYNLEVIRAKFADGVLQITIPKTQKTTPDQEPGQQLQQQPKQDSEQDAKPKDQSYQPSEYQTPASGNGTGDKHKSDSDKEEESATVPGSSNDVDSSAAPAAGLRRRRSFVPKIGYGGGLCRRTRGTGLKTAVAMLLLLAGLWFAYVNYWPGKDGRAGTSLAHYSKYFHHHDGF